MSSSFPSTSPLLDVRNLSIRFKTETGYVNVVHSVSFSVSAGETFCLVGESGCGKSMSAMALLGLLPYAGEIASGTVRLEGQELTTMTEKALCEVRGRRIGMIFQEPMTSLNPVLRVGDQTAEPLIHHFHMSRKDALEKVKDLFGQVGIPDPAARLRDFPHQLSGGMRQRVMIAMALACQPALLLADEPTTALDVTIQGQILSLLRELSESRGMGLLLITHDLGVVAEMADTVGVMYSGYIVEKGPVAALFARPLHPYTQGLMESAPPPAQIGIQTGSEHDPQPVRQNRLQAIPGTVPAPHEMPEGCPFRPRCGKAEDRCRELPPLVQLGEGPVHREVRCWRAAF